MFSFLYEFPEGRLLLVKSEKGLSICQYIKDDEHLGITVDSLKKRGIFLTPTENEFEEEKRLFDLYFSGKRTDFNSLSLDLLSASPFQKKVWAEARKIPYGKTGTYKSLALRINSKGYRSVGQALSRNPLLIIIPCHRVLCSDGSLGGFSAGLWLKKYLLRLEAES
ncbi:MAG: methylated-DNA--[protein]-cysteine S-methyltransferase [Candidatus Aminicenantales bacterium]